MNELSLRGLLHRAANEVETLAVMAKQLDDDLGKLATDTSSANGLNQNMQEIDLLFQSLEDVARFLHHLALETDSSSFVEVMPMLDLLRLHDIRQRLFQEPDQSDGVLCSGNVTLF